MTIKNSLLYIVAIVVFGITACNNQAPSEVVVSTTTTIPPTTTSSSSPLSVPLTPELSTDEQMRVYRGLPIYSTIPPFELTYDAGIWQLNEDERPEPGLINQHIPNCYLALQEAAREATVLGTANLASLEWGIFEGGTEESGRRGNNIVYNLNYQGGSYIFRVDLPEPYQTTAKSMCQQLAEKVIDTFSIVEE